jgi:hypothetical protein
MAAARRLIHEHAARHSIPEADAHSFFATVQANAVRAGDRRSTTL